MVTAFRSRRRSSDRFSGRSLKRRRQSRARVREIACRLRPGLFLVQGDLLWRHWREPAPDHLRLTKGGQRSRASAAGPWWAGWLDSLHRGGLALVPPWIFVNRARDQDGENGGYGLAVATFDGGIVLLDPGAGKVARQATDGQVTPEYVAMRRRYARHVRSPSFTVDDDGWLIEEFVVGHHFLELDADGRIRAAREILRNYASLARAEQRGDTAELIDEVTALIRSSNLPETLRDVIEPPSVLEQAARWPMIPSQVALIPKNVIMVDGKPVVIDLPNLRFAPAFCDPVNFICKARSAVLSAFLAGDLDEDLSALGAAAGIHFEPTERTRVELIAFNCLLAAHRRAGGDRGVFEREAAGRWREVWLNRPPRWS